jgi:hypothetical protein
MIDVFRHTNQCCSAGVAEALYGSVCCRLSVDRDVEGRRTYDAAESGDQRLGTS